MNSSTQIRVSVDIGSRQHSIAIGLADGDVLDEFDIPHRPEGFNQFFERIEQHRQRHGGEVAVAMEGYNGFARPLDSLVRVRGYRLYNINNLKLARFKEIFPAAAKNDRIDARKGLELFQLRDHLPVAKDVLQEVMPTPRENDELRRLSQRRRILVDEGRLRGRVLHFTLSLSNRTARAANNQRVNQYSAMPVGYCTSQPFKLHINNPHFVLSPE